MSTIYTIGHSTRTLDDFIDTLRAHGIKTLVDIRSFPGSRRMPWFSREELEKSLPEAGIRYLWEKRLGGRRKKIRNDSPNTGLRNDAFRNYADYMLTDEFQQGAEDVRKLADESTTAIMCAERMWFQCHRMMASDYYTAHGNTVLHIGGKEEPKPHKLMREAHIVNGKLIYNAESLF